MMNTTYTIRGPGRVCSVSGRELALGEMVCSAIVAIDGRLERLDFAEASWTTPPTDSIAWWKSPLIVADETRKTGWNDGLLMECFTALQDSEDPARRRFRYVLALLLMRRRKLKFEDARRSGAGEILSLRGAGQLFEVVDPGLSDDEVQAVQDEVFRVLDGN